MPKARSHPRRKCCFKRAVERAHRLHTLVFNSLALLIKSHWSPRDGTWPLLFLPLGQPGSTQPARTSFLPWSPRLGSPTSARHSRPSPSSPATTRSPCSSCCRKCASSPSTSPQILSSVKVRCRAKPSRDADAATTFGGVTMYWRTLGPTFNRAPSPPSSGLSVLPVVLPTHSLSSWSPKSLYKFSPAAIFGQNVGCRCMYVGNMSSVRTHLAGLPASPGTAWSLGSPARLRCLLCSTEGASVQLQGLFRAPARWGKLGAAVGGSTCDARCWLQFG